MTRQKLVSKACEVNQHVEYMLWTNVVWSSNVGTSVPHLRVPRMVYGLSQISCQCNVNLFLQWWQVHQSQT